MWSQVALFPLALVLLVMLITTTTAVQAHSDKGQSPKERCSSKNSLPNEFYERLEVRPDDSMWEIGQAYRRLALLYHPDKNPGYEELCQIKFIQIREAYEMLSDKTTRKIYDNFSGFYTHDKSYDDKRSSPEKKPSSSPAENKSSSGENPTKPSSSTDKKPSSAPTTKPSPESKPTSEKKSPSTPPDAADEAETKSESDADEKAFPPSNEPLVIPVYCTLEEFYTGTIKDYVVHLNGTVKKALKSNKRKSTKEGQKEFLFYIKPGYKDGTQVKFPATEDFPRPVVFQIYEIPHKEYQRDGIDLTWTCHLPRSRLEEGTKIKVPLLDGSYMVINTKDYSNIKQGFTLSFVNKGMPSAVKKKGKLIVKFNIIEKRKKKE